MNIVSAATLAIALSFASVGITQAAVVAPPQLSVEQYTETMKLLSVEKLRNDPAQMLKHMASFLMATKNGISLYGDSALPDYEVHNLQTMLLIYSFFARSFSKSEEPYATSELRSLAAEMAADYKEAGELLQLDRADKQFAARMESYQAGIGYSAYRKAESLGIVQIWVGGGDK